MRRTLLLCVLSLACAAAPAAADPRAGVTLDRCATGIDAEQRAATFVARMRQIPGAERMRLRFHLEHRAAGGPWRPAGALGGWRVADPGVGAYVYTKRVEGLALAGDYRVAVRFRWLRADGGLVAAARRRSAPCWQPDPRANLRPVAVLVEHEPGGITRYGVRIRNTGMVASGPYTVAFSAAGEPVAPAASAAALGPGEVTLVEVRGPACAPGVVVDAVADAAFAIDERREDDNGLSALCPAR